jgi:hypothetical protein
VIRAILGLSGVVVVISSVIGYFAGKETLLTPQNLASVVFYVVGYYFSERCCQKKF